MSSASEQGGAPPPGPAAGVVFAEAGPEHHEALSAFLVENDVPAVTRTFTPFPMSAETARRIALEPSRDRY